MSYRATKTTRHILALLLALTMVAGACSEPAPQDQETTTSAPATESEPDTSDTEPEPDTSDTEPDTSDTSDTEPEPDTSDTEPEPEPEPEPDTSDTEPEPDAEQAHGEPVGDPVVDSLAGLPWFLGEIPAEAVVADDSRQPIVLGMINQEDTPFGSFPEVRIAAQTAVAFINNELGGVAGRPLELHTCITAFNPEQSASCAQKLVQAGAVALVGGVDVTSNGSFPIIEQNELPMVGGIPAGMVEQRSEFAFSFSGGGAGGAAAFMKHAADNGATKVLLAYGEFESFEIAARDYAAVVGTSLGLEVELVSFSLFATDYLPVLTKAQEVGADAIIVLAADSACVPVMQNASDLGLDAQLYLTGACATDAIIEASGEAIIGVLFNSEGPLTENDPEGNLYAAALERYATGEAGGAGTVGFRGMMNLYGLLTELGPDNISSESILAAARATVDQPSFWGHPYTCDGNQVPGLAALCAPQQLLFEIPQPGGVPQGVGDWIDTAELFQVVDG